MKLTIPEPVVYVTTATELRGDEACSLPVHRRSRPGPRGRGGTSLAAKGVGHSADNQWNRFCERPHLDNQSGTEVTLLVENMLPYIGTYNHSVARSLCLSLAPSRRIFTRVVAQVAPEFSAQVRIPNY